MMRTAGGLPDQAESLEAPVKTGFYEERCGKPHRGLSKGHDLTYIFKRVTQIHSRSQLCSILSCKENNLSTLLPGALRPFAMINNAIKHVFTHLLLCLKITSVA